METLIVLLVFVVVAGLIVIGRVKGVLNAPSEERPNVEPVEQLESFQSGNPMSEIGFPYGNK